MSIKIEEKAILLTAESKPYDVNGNTGVSHRIRVSIGGEIYPCKSTEKQVKDLVEYVGQEGTAVISLDSRKENVSVSLDSFEV